MAEGAEVRIVGAELEDYAHGGTRIAVLRMASADGRAVEPLRLRMGQRAAGGWDGDPQGLGDLEAVGRAALGTGTGDVAIDTVVPALEGHGIRVRFGADRLGGRTVAEVGHETASGMAWTRLHAAGPEAGQGAQAERLGRRQKVLAVTCAAAAARAGTDRAQGERAANSERGAETVARQARGHSQGPRTRAAVRER